MVSISKPDDKKENLPQRPFATKVNVFLTYATLVLLLALFPAAFFFGDDPQGTPFQTIFLTFVAVAAICFGAFAFNMGRYRARERKRRGTQK